MKTLSYIVVLPLLFTGVFVALVLFEINRVPKLPLGWTCVQQPIPTVGTNYYNEVCADSRLIKGRTTTHDTITLVGQPSCRHIPQPESSTTAELELVWYGGDYTKQCVLRFRNDVLHEKELRDIIE